MTRRGPFRCFKTSPEVIRLAVMLHIRFPLSLRNAEDLLHEPCSAFSAMPFRRTVSQASSNHGQG